MDTLAQRIEAAIQYYDDEAKLWPQLEARWSGARNRLPRLVELGAPEIIIENEIGIVRMRANQLKEKRLGVTIQ
jgi:hypothetical protein